MQVTRTLGCCDVTGDRSDGSMPAAEPGAAFLKRRGRRRPRLPRGVLLRGFVPAARAAPPTAATLASPAVSCAPSLSLATAAAGASGSPAGVRGRGVGRVGLVLAVHPALSGPVSRRGARRPILHRVSSAGPRAARPPARPFRSAPAPRDTAAPTSSTGSRRARRTSSGRELAQQADARLQLDERQQLRLPLVVEREAGRQDRVEQRLRRGVVEQQLAEVAVLGEAVVAARGGRGCSRRAPRSAPPPTCP